MKKNTMKALEKGQSSEIPAVSLDDNAGGEKTPDRTREDEILAAMKTGTVHEVVTLLAIDALILGSIYVAVRAIGHRVCAAYDLEIGWLTHLIEGSIATVVGVPTAVIANKGIAALPRAQALLGIEALRLQMEERSEEATAHLLAQTRGEMSVYLTELSSLKEDIGVLTDRADAANARADEAMAALGRLENAAKETPAENAAKETPAKETPAAEATIENLPVTKTPAKKKTGTK